MGRPKASTTGAHKHTLKDSERVPVASTKKATSKDKKSRAAKDTTATEPAVISPATSLPANRRKRSRSEEPTVDDDDNIPSLNKRPRKGRPRKDQAKSRSTKVQEPESIVSSPIINQVPKQVMAILNFGSGDSGELGLGPKRNEAVRPILNPFLDPSNPASHHIVDFACGGMHTIALSSNNKIITWGVNDNEALGRTTDWEGGLRDVDAESGDDDDNDGLNPFESTPIEIPTECFPSNTRFAQVAAGDSCSFALTDTGLVYGWGTFRDSQGHDCFGHDPDGKLITKQELPIQIRGIPRITQITCGANHALALDTTGNTWAWGCNEQNQFGRHLFGRQQDSFVPTQVRVCRNKAKYIASGPYHSFAIDKQDNVWAWGANSYGEAGDPATAGGDSAILRFPMKIRDLCQKQVTTLAGGSHHSAAVTATGECYVWGRIDAGQLGIAFTPEQIEDATHIRRDDRGKPRICLRPATVPNVEDVVDVACGADHTLFITKAGAAYSSGFGSLGQLGLSSYDDVHVATLIACKSVKERVLTRAGAGGNSSVVAGLANSD
ncbi:regulator of chromosome condensation 1/beta-lactamase-inhibitor protein II [Xylariaceae sp. FL1019]|nr:regulator of chromosome condensation 1/beta-lactamase-inhibitor protein II [Xylariaceae sp. FL1019]